MPAFANRKKTNPDTSGQQIYIKPRHKITYALPTSNFIARANLIPSPSLHLDSDYSSFFNTTVNKACFHSTNSLEQKIVNN